VAAMTLRRLDFEVALEYVVDGAAWIDFRPTEAYLEVHLPGSLSLLYEFGPGMAARARDCLPLNLPLILLADAATDMVNAAAALRGKGFTVLGQLNESVDAWVASGRPLVSTEIAAGTRPPPGQLLDVGDPGSAAPEAARRIPIESLWTRVDEVDDDSPVVIAAGFGVRAGLAVGILERDGREDVVFWKSRS
jgi:rhodanese-related sulfurtransferase